MCEFGALKVLTCSSERFVLYDSFASIQRCSIIAYKWTRFLLIPDLSYLFCYSKIKYYVHILHFMPFPLY